MDNKDLKIPAIEDNQALQQLRQGQTAMLNLLEDLRQEIEVRRQTEQALRESTALLEAQFAHSPDIILIIDRDYRILRINQIRAGDFTMEGLKGKDAIAILPQEYREPVRQKIDHCFNIGDPQQLEHGIGDGKWVSARIVPLRYEGDIRQVMIISTDITERKRAELALRESETRYRALFEGIHNGVAVYEAKDDGLDFVFKDFNPAGERIDHDQRDRLIGKSVLEMRPNIERFGLLDVFRKVWQTGESAYHPVTLYQDDRLTGWYDNYVYKLPSGEIVAIFENVTEQKQTEKSLLESEARLKQAASGGHIGLWDWDLDTNKVYFSPEWKRQIGYEDHEISDDFNEWQSRVHPDDLGPSLQTVRSFVENPRPGYNIEFRFRHKDGSYRWIMAQGSFLIDDQGKSRHMLGSHVDITDRKKTEEALSKSEAFLMETEKISRVGGWEYDVINKRNNWTDGTYRICGVSRDEFDSNDIQAVASFFESPDRELVVNSFRDAVEQGKPYDLVVRCRNKQGNVLWTRTIAKPVLEDGKVVKVSGIFLDLTDIKKAEESLKDSEEKLRLFSEHAPAALAMFDRDMRYVAFSRRWISDYHLREGDLIGRSHYEIFPEIPDELKAIHRRGMNGEVVKGDDDKFERADGSIQWLRWEMRPWKAADGSIGGIVIFSEDITERKLAEQRLLDYRMRLRALASRLALTEERERRSLAERLHDDVSQYLVFCKMKLEMIQKEAENPSLGAGLNQVCDTLTRLLSDTRVMTFELSSPVLRVLGFEAALAAWLRDEIEQKHGIRTEFLDDGQPKPMDENLKALLFRTVRELLTNTVKHAHAHLIRVAISREQDSLLIRVEDDGQGFVLSEGLSAKTKGFGLFSIQERLTELDGSLEMDTAPGRGCRAAIRVPLDLDVETAINRS